MWLDKNRFFEKHVIFFGILAALFASILIALTNIFGKFLVDSDFSDEVSNPITVIMLTNLVTVLIFTPLAKKKNQKKRLVRKKHWVIISCMGVADALANILLFYGLQEIEAKTASLILDAEILFTIIIAIIVFKERLSHKEKLFCLMIFSGSIIVPVTELIISENFIFSDMFFYEGIIILASIIYAVDTGLARFVSDKISPERITQFSALVGVLFSATIFFFFGIKLDLTIQHIPYILAIGIFVTGFSYYLMVFALKYIGIIRTIIIYSSVSSFGIIFSGVFLGENITLVNIASVIGIVSGVYFLRHKIASLE